MRIDVPVARRRPLSLTSLIDVIFLLLLFFMLSSTFTRFSQVEVVAGRAGAASAGSERPDIVVRIGAGGADVNGIAVAPGAMAVELSALALSGARAAVVLVREDAASQALVDALEALRAAGLSAIVAR